MHAASVYPEPGSNSLNMIYQGYLSNHHTEFVCSSYFVRALFLKFKRIFGVFYFSSLLFNFQGASRTSWGAALLLYQNLFSLSIPFLKFFKVFSEVFWALRPCSCRGSSLFLYSVLCLSSRWRLAYYINSLPLCQLHFSSFFAFSLLNNLHHSSAFTLCSLTYIPQYTKKKLFRAPFRLNILW